MSFHQSTALWGSSRTKHRISYLFGLSCVVFDISMHKNAKLVLGNNIIVYRIYHFTYPFPNFTTDVGLPLCVLPSMSRSVGMTKMVGPEGLEPPTYKL